MQLKSPKDFVLNESVSFESLIKEEDFKPVREILTPLAIKYQFESLDTEEAYMWITLNLDTCIVAYLHSDDDIWYLDLNRADLDIKNRLSMTFDDLESLQAYTEDLKLSINSKSRM